MEHRERQQQQKNTHRKQKKISWKMNRWNEIRPSFCWYHHLYLKRHNKKLKINSINITHPHRKSIFKISLNFHSFSYTLYGGIVSRHVVALSVCFDQHNRNIRIARRLLVYLLSQNLICVTLLNRFNFHFCYFLPNQSVCGSIVQSTLTHHFAL